MLAERIAARLKALGFSQQDLAERAKTTQQSVSGYVRGETFPSTPVLNRLAKALETTTDYLLGHSSEPDQSFSKTDLNEEQRHFLSLYDTRQYRKLIDELLDREIEEKIGMKVERLSSGNDSQDNPPAVQHDNKSRIS